MVTIKSFKKRRIARLRESILSPAPFIGTKLVLWIYTGQEGVQGKEGREVENKTWTTS